MQLQRHLVYAGHLEFSGTRRMLVEAGFDLSIFKCEAEIQLAAREIDRITKTELVKRFGVTPAWIIGDSGPFIGCDGIKKLTRAFELGHELGIDTVGWMVRLTSTEVIKMLPHLKERRRIQNFN